MAGSFCSPDRNRGGNDGAHDDLVLRAGCVRVFAAVLGASVQTQLVVFLIVSFILLLFTRPLAMRFVNRETVKTNVDGLIGRKAKVIAKIDNNEPSGAAVIDGQEWTARSADEAVTIPVGTHVRSKEVRGVKLIVEMIPYEKENRN